MVVGAFGVAGGALGLMGIFTLPAGFTVVLPVLLALGGGCLGYGVPLWSQARAAEKGRSREWQHALELLRLREQQAEENPALTVEVLDRVDERQPLLASAWNACTSTASRYVQ